MKDSLAFLLGLSFALLSACATARNPFDAMQHVELEACRDSQRPPTDCRFEPLTLSAVDERDLLQLIRSAHEREEREEREAKREGTIVGGVWGFVSYSYRVSFPDAGEYAWLHVAGDVAWLDGEGAMPNVVFDEAELRRLLRILGRQ